MRTTCHRKGRTSKTALLISAVLLSQLLVSCQDTSPEYPPRAMPSGISGDAEQLERGEELFMNKCASCHGKPSEGRSDRAVFFEPPAPDFTDSEVASIDPAYLYWRIETGKDVEPFRSQGSVMPAWGQYFTEQQIWQLVAYIQSRAH